MEKIKLPSGLEYYRQWENDGAIVMTNAKTIKRYHELKYNTEPNLDRYGVFFAFSDEQFEKGYKHLIELGLIKDGDKVKRYDSVSGMFCANLDLLKEFFRFYKDKNGVIREECDPQEVYFYEFNNFECMYGDDDEAIQIIIDIFGVEVAKSIKRYSVGHSIDYILIPGSVKHTWMMLERLRRDCDYYLGNGNRCAKHLWAHGEKEQIAEMRKQLASLPEEYRINCITSEQIDEYERKMLNQ